MSARGRIAVAFGALLLTLVFAATRFPWDRFAPVLSSAASEAAGVRVELGSLELAWGALGVAMIASDVRVDWPAGDGTRFAAVAVRPAASLGWLRGEPVLRVRTRGGPGDFDGIAGTTRVTGTLEVAEAGDLPWTIEPPITGAFTSELDLAIATDRITGAVLLAGTGGSLLPPGLPIAIPFDQLTGTLRLTERGLALDPVVVAGPLASGRVTGSIDPPGGRWQVAILDLVVDLDHFDPDLAAMIQSFGLKLAPGTRITIQGTAANPRIR